MQISIEELNTLNAERDKLIRRIAILEEKPDKGSRSDIVKNVFDACKSLTPAQMSVIRTAILGE